MSALAHELSRDGEIGGIAASPISEYTNGPKAAEITRDEFAATYAAKFDHMVGQLCRKGANRDQAVDSVQNAFATCWERRSQLREKACLSGWVLVSAIHRGHSSRMRDRFVQWPVDFQPAIQPGIDEDEIDLRRALDDLPEMQRQVLELMIEGLSGKEIAGQLKTTLDTVYSQASHARRALREKIGSDHGKRPDLSSDHNGEQKRVRLA
jgi:RNA polymerase sigma factor (sigma-70 family)